MSQATEDVRRIHAAFDDFNRADVDALVEALDPDIQWEHAVGSGAPEEGVYRGRDEARRLFDRLLDSWAEIRFDLLEIVDAGDGQYVARGILRAKGRTSGLELEMAAEYALEMRDGRAVRVQFALTGPVPRQAVDRTTDVA